MCLIGAVPLGRRFAQLPSLERDLLARASDAVVRSADTREIRIGFGSLFKSK